MKSISMKILLITIFLFTAFSIKAEVTWNKMFGYPPSEKDEGYSIKQTPEGGFILTGLTHSQCSYEPYCMWLLKTDSSGNKEWEILDHETMGYDVQVTQDQNYVVVGYKVISSSNTDVWLMKVDNQGNEIWSKVYDGGEYQVISMVLVKDLWIST